MSHPAKSHHGSLDDTVTHTPTLSPTTLNWPTAEDWVKVIAIGLLSAILTNTALMAPAFLQQVKGATSDAIAATQARISNNANVEAVPSPPPCLQKSTGSQAPSTVVVYQLIPAASHRCR